MIVSLVVIGCGSSPTPTPTPDLAMSMSGGDMTVYSLCGHPGDTGNSKGVGKYCMSSPDCAGGQMASVCSTLMPIQQGPVYFCTFPCTAGTTPDPCGENATCTCLSSSPTAPCGCVPDVCRIGLFG
jgi:hypothetical protein